MTHADLSAIRHTSVTIRAALRQRLREGEAELLQRGIRFSEQRLLRECIRLALRLWHGRKEIASRNRKYNRRRGPYLIIPFYATEALRRVAHARCHHSGMSFSRLVDFAVAHYLPRVVEYWLRFDDRDRNKADVALWKERYERRGNREDFIISYESRTAKNNGRSLEFTEKTEILPWPPPNWLAA